MGPTNQVDAFFQDYSESGLRAQVHWCKHNLALSDHYFSNLLRINHRRFESWQDGRVSLPDEQQEVLRAFWRLHLHLRTLYDRDVEAVRRMYEHVPSGDAGSVAPPWSGTSIKAYIEANGGSAIQTVGEWLESLRVPRAL